MRHFFVFVGLVLMCYSAGLAERDAGRRAWGADWVAYCVDVRLGPAANLIRPSEGTAKERFTALLADLDRRIAAADAPPENGWVACATNHRAVYLSSQLLVPVFGPAPPATPLAELDVERAVERIRRPLRALSERSYAWLASAPTAGEIELRLGGQRSLEKNDAADKPHRDRNGLVLTLNELDAKATHAQGASQALGRATVVIAAGTLGLFAILLICGRATWPLLLLLPGVLTGALVMVALSLSSPPLRNVAVRHLAAGMGVLWLPLLAACAGVMLTRLARHDRWLGPRLLAFSRRRSGLAGRAAALGLAAFGVGLLLRQASQQAELWLLIAAAGLALVAARNATVTAVSNASASFGWPVVVSCGLAVIAAALLRDDRGAALLALGLIAAWLITFTAARWSLATLVAVGMVLIGWSGQLREPTATLPASHQELQAYVDAEREAVSALRSSRFQCAATVQVCANSDVWRALALARAGTNERMTGLGLVHLPGNGLGAQRSADRVILQLANDYFGAAVIATFGWSGVVLLAAYALSNFWIGAGALGSLRFGGRSDSELLLAALGGFGLIACGFRTLITTAGATAAAPLTGLPAPGISYGVAAALGWGLYLGLALGTQQHRGAGSDVDANT